MMNIDPNSRKILIVDDELYVRQSFFDFFEDREWQVLSAESGETALDLLGKEACDAAVVDIRMGGMDGETFIRKASERYTEMVFIICTGSPEYKASEDLLGLPCVADHVFAKPVTDPHELENEISKLLSDKYK